MREILFRGKRTNNGRWIEGYYMHHLNRMQSPLSDCIKPEDEDHIILYDGFADWNMPRDITYVHVDPETVCQYTGLKDKNGKRIFEGDIVRDTGAAEYRLLSDGRKKPRSRLAVVKYGLHDVPSDDPFCWGMALGFYLDGDTVYPTLAWYKPYYEYGKYEIEVIGNIHDNPEMIGGKEDA